MINDRISILITGGTFDKEYDEINGILSFKKTQIHEMLHQSRAKIEFEINPLCLFHRYYVEEYYSYNNFIYN